MTALASLGMIAVLLIQHANEWHHEDGNKLRPHFVATAEKLLPQRAEIALR